MYPIRHNWLSARGRLRPQLTPGLWAALLLMLPAACSSPVKIPAPQGSGPVTYMTPTMPVSSDTVPFTATPAVLSIDRSVTPGTFRQETFSFAGTQSGAQVNYSGQLLPPPGLARGLEELEFTYLCGLSVCTSYCPPQADGSEGCSPLPDSGWAIELPGQSGGLSEVAGEPFVPMVPALSCPSSTAQTYLFMTVPSELTTAGSGDPGWIPQSESAYGSADISATGSTVTVANIRQYILPSQIQDGQTTPPDEPAASVTGACFPTVYGETVAVPAAPAVTTTATGVTVYGPQAMLGVGPSGLLVQDNGGTDYLGSGTAGTIGLLQPSSAVDTAALLGAQYLGFIYGAGSNRTFKDWSSSVASFGFPAPPQSTCSGVVPQGDPVLYGGDFPDDNPASAEVQANGGFPPVSDLAIDLGTGGNADTSSYGIFPAATVCVGSGFNANTAGMSYSFPAVVIAGQLNGRFAVFVLGVDTTGTPSQGWGIYLLQSN